MGLTVFLAYVLNLYYLGSIFFLYQKEKHMVRKPKTTIDGYEPKINESSRDISSLNPMMNPIDHIRETEKVGINGAFHSGENI
jgi:hypothetical protein